MANPLDKFSKYAPKGLKSWGGAFLAGAATVAVAYIFWDPCAKALAEARNLRTGGAA